MPPTTRLSTSSQNWTSVKSSKSLKDTLEERVNAFFDQSTHRDLHKNAYDNWIKHTNARKSQWDLRTILDITKQLPLSTVKFVSNSAAYKERVHFLYPFIPDMESSHLKTPPASPAKSSVSQTQTPTQGLTPTQSPNLLDTSPNEHTEYTTPTSTTPVFTVPPSNPPHTEGTQVSTQDTDTFDDTERGVTGRFIFNQVQRTFDTQFQEQLNQTINTSFNDHFERNMNLYSDTLDTRIKHIVSEALEELFEQKLKPHIKTSVKDMYDTIDSATMETIIHDKIGEQIHTQMEQSATSVINSKAKLMSDVVLESIVQPKLERMVQEAKSNLQQVTDNRINEIKNVPTSFMQSLRDIKASYESLVTTTKREIHEARDASILDLSTEANSHIEYIAQEAGDHLNNLSDIAAERSISLKRTLQVDFAQAQSTLATSCCEHLHNMKMWFDTNSSAFYSSRETQKALEPKTPVPFQEQQKVWYTKDKNSVSAPVKIVAVHNDDDGECYYTVRFPTGLEKQTTSSCLSTSGSVHSKNVASRWHDFVDVNVQRTEASSSIPRIKSQNQTSTSKSSRAAHNTAIDPVLVDFDDDDYEPIVSTRQTTRNAQTTQPTADEMKNNGPSSYYINQFHKFFKGKVENENTLLTFYQQLHSQGPGYGIFLIDLKDIRPDIDLCPSDVSHVAREGMKIALYQRLQDVDCVHLEYVDAQNHIESYSGISDGFAVLYQMLRMVHPYLMEGTKLYNAPKLSEANNLFQYAAMCRNYFLFQEIQNRIYTDKEQSELFLQNVDDPDYQAGRAQCITELGVATMDGTSTVRISNMRFANLPTTLQQYTNKLNLHSSSPIVRALRDSKLKHRNNPIPSRKSSYEPYQCIGCGLWGHKVTKCKTVPKIAIAMDYIHKKAKHVDKLVEEFKRINNKATKTSSVRVLQTNGMHNTYDDPDTYLQSNDIDVPMEDVPFNEE